MPANIVKHFSNKTGKSKEEVDSLWNKSKEIVKKEYKDVSDKDDNFYQIVTGVLKKMLGLNEEGEVAVNNPAMTTNTMGDLAYRKPIFYQKRFGDTKKKKPKLIYDKDVKKK